MRYKVTGNYADGSEYSAEVDADSPTNAIIKCIATDIGMSYNSADYPDDGAFVGSDVNPNIARFIFDNRELYASMTVVVL